MGWKNVKDKDDIHGRKWKFIKFSFRAFKNNYSLIICHFNKGSINSFIFFFLYKIQFFTELSFLSRLCYNYWEFQILLSFSKKTGSLQFFMFFRIYILALLAVQKKFCAIITNKGIVGYFRSSWPRAGVLLVFRPVIVCILFLF